MVQFLITNTLPVDIHIDLTLPNILENGETKVISSQLTALTDKVITEDISGCEIYNYKNPGSVIDSLDYFANVLSDSTEDYTLVSDEDSISIDVVTDSIQMASVTGVLDTVDFNIEPVELDKIDVFQDINGQVRLNDLTMQLVFRNEINLPIEVDLRVVGRRTDTQDSVAINVSETIAASSQSPTTIVNMDGNYSNPSIVDLLEILPDEITIRGSAILHGEGSVSVGDGLRVEYNVSSPLNLEIGEPLTFDSEIDSITYDDLDEDQRDQIINDLSNVKTKFNFINHVPIGASFKYYMAVDSTELYDNAIPDPSRKIVLETEIEPGLVGPNGYVQTAVSSTWEKEITDQQREIFNYPTIYVRQELTIPATNGVIKIRQDDSIEIEAILDFQVTINSESD